MEENLARLYPKLIERWNAAGVPLRTEVSDVAIRFRGQIARLMGDNYANDPALAERVRKGAEYFHERCSPLAPLLAEAVGTSVDNKEVKKRLGSLLDRVGKELRVKSSTLAAARDGFSVESYLEAKGAAIAETESGTKAKVKTPKAEKIAQRKDGGTAKNGSEPAGRAPDNGHAPQLQTNEDGSDDILNPGLFELLR